MKCEITIAYTEESLDTLEITNEDFSDGSEQEQRNNRNEDNNHQRLRKPYYNLKNNIRVYRSEAKEKDKQITQLKLWMTGEITKLTKQLIEDNKIIKKQI